MWWTRREESQEVGRKRKWKDQAYVPQLLQGADVWSPLLQGFLAQILGFSSLKFWTRKYHDFLNFWMTFGNSCAGSGFWLHQRVLCPNQCVACFFPQIWQWFGHIPTNSKAQWNGWANLVICFLHNFHNIPSSRWVLRKSCRSKLFLAQNGSFWVHVADFQSNDGTLLADSRYPDVTRSKPTI